MITLEEKIGCDISQAQPKGASKEPLRILRAVLEHKAGTKDQRNALLRVIKQVHTQVVDAKAESAANAVIRTVTRNSATF
jgi:hypothetical protein